MFNKLFAESLTESFSHVNLLPMKSSIHTDTLSSCIESTEDDAYPFKANTCGNLFMYCIQLVLLVKLDRNSSDLRNAESLSALVMNRSHDRCAFNDKKKKLNDKAQQIFDMY